MFADQTFKIPETGMLESARILAEANNNPELLKVLPNLRVRASNWPMHGVRFGLTSVILLSDLRLTLLVPPSGAHFITSDHPVILLNQAFVNILRDQSAGGLAMRGVQLFLPLSPDLLLLAFDPVCYRVGQPNRRLVHITRKEDVDLINALQILNANQCLYFRDEEDEPLFRNLLFKFQNKRPDPQKLVEKHEITEDGQKGSLIACYAPSIPLPGIWSFCKTRYQFSGQNYVPRNEYLCHLHREYQKDCQKHGTLLPLSKWLADKTAEREKR